MNKPTIIALLLCLTGLEFHALSVAHGRAVNGPWQTSVPTVTAMVATGTYDWLHSAQRVVLPKAVMYVAAALRADFLRVWLVAVFVALFTANAVCYFTLASRWPEIAWGFTIASAAAFVGLQDYIVFMAADLVDLTIWFLFAYGIWTSAKLWFFAALFVVELHNREVAIFIPLWCALFYLLPCTSNWRHWLAGLTALAAVPAGMAYTMWLRKALCTVATHDPAPLVNWKSNLTNLSQLFGGAWTPNPLCPTSGQTRYEMWVVVFAMAIVVIAWSGLAWGWHKVRVGLLFAACWAALWYSAVITEIRCFNFLTPLVAFCFYKPTELHRSERSERSSSFPLWPSVELP